MVAADPNDPWADDALEHAAQTALDRGDLASARRLAGNFVTRFPQSPLNPEVRLIEARAAAREGKHDEAVTISKALLDQPADPKSQAPAATLPAIIPAARYELALSYRALGKADLADPILAGLAKGRMGRSPSMPSFWSASPISTRDDTPRLSSCYGISVRESTGRSR